MDVRVVVVLVIDIGVGHTAGRGDFLQLDRELSSLRFVSMSVGSGDDVIGDDRVG
jgi:hypothetical protein